MNIGWVIDINFFLFDIIFRGVKWQRITTKEIQNEILPIDYTLLEVKTKKSGKQTGKFITYLCANKHLNKDKSLSYVKRRWNKNVCCAICSGVFKYEFEDIKKLFNQKQHLDNISLISYNSKNKIIIFKCNIHKKNFSTSLGNFTRNKFINCQKCVGYFGEEFCREILKEFFPGHSFDKNRTFLKNKINKLLELDGLSQNVVFNNKKYDIAFEYQGEQHFNEKHFRFKNIKQKFKTIKNNDKIKKKFFTKYDNKILLEIKHSLNKKEIFEQIIFQLKNYNILIEYKNINLDKIEFNIRSNNKIQRTRLEKIKIILKKNNLKFLSYDFNNFGILRIKYECFFGHEHKTPYFEIEKEHFPCILCEYFRKCLVSNGFYKKWKKNYEYTSIKINNKSKVLASNLSKLKLFIIHKIGAIGKYIYKLSNLQEILIFIDKNLSKILNKIEDKEFKNLNKLKYIQIISEYFNKNFIILF